MTAVEKLRNIEKINSSKLCIGLDPQLEKIPFHLNNQVNGIYDFNRSIIDATSDLVSSYKINFAFYEQYGPLGIDILQKTLEYIPNSIFTIADAKRGDIGNSSKAYANSIFEFYNFDSITVSPYMGFESLEPFIDYSDKLTFILTLTSNSGANDFQKLLIDDKPLYIKVIERFAGENYENNIGFVVGATHPNDISNIRAIIPNNYLLIPGIGTQGGNIEQVFKNNNNGGAIINISRDIIYASQDENFSEKIREKATLYQQMLNISF